jgi:hypothetical protein
MADKVNMDVLRMQAISKDFDRIGDVLKAVYITLEVVGKVLQVTAWLGLGGSAAEAAYITHIQPELSKAANNMYEISGGIQGAIDAFSKGDFSGSQHFV